jgi:hypothetical protein
MYQRSDVGSLEGQIKNLLNEALGVSSGREKEASILLIRRFLRVQQRRRVQFIVVRGKKVA